MRSILSIAMIALTAVAGVSAHGYMSRPFCRGCEKAAMQVDDLKSPNFRGICRGEPAGKVTNVSGGSLTLGFTITAPHVGNCKVFLLDKNLGNAIQIGERMDCAAPGKVADWSLNLPSSASGSKVVRWTWDACHVSPCEKYEQCADINIIGGGSGGGGNNGGNDNDDGEAPAKPTKSKTPTRPTKTKGSSRPTKTSAPKDDASTGPTSAPAPAPGGSCTHGAFTCSGSRIGICNFGQWSWISCSGSTKCTNQGSNYYCA
ncbi:hypothetical protein THASP1DRAFT_29127 [Thamnocephalis sphaerospora]|uniref:Chitin-binding type-4 domain-containing protein n=1 Tax=Thamnocephalis sphaerospora TaxID=78915 RepID=A0A4P9XUF5_9FUNG|nr:hypothetical protein THASP1DRAFT_29127 [Thamnocephalis sphaerospora]|eukprot:RKP09070.1 hypothetical protein THASP1DRAFT_29127 [Thamnocephalis sphaerospora]